MSREHVFPQWLSELFPEFSDAEGFDYERRLVTHSQDIPHTRPGPAFDVVTKDVCEACNNGWMHTLETEARPVITPMVTGNVALLSASDQFVVATWGTKTMLTMQGTNIGKERVASAALYRWFYEHQQPLPGSHVWLIRYADRTHWPVVAHQYAMSVRPAGDPIPEVGDPLNGFGVVFTVGHLGFWLFGVDLPGTPATHSGSDEAHVCIWPAYGPDVCWPPATAFASDCELGDLARRMPEGTHIHGPHLDV